jgi:predicted nucleic acid-binding protein
LDSSERHHAWVVDRIAELEPPLVVCEAVLTETYHLLARYPKALDSCLDMLANGALSAPFAVQDNVREIRALVGRYRNVPMSLADACIVRMAELYDRAAVLTLDSDFLIYRKKGRLPLNVIHPAAP